MTEYYDLFEHVFARAVARQYISEHLMQNGFTNLNRKDWESLAEFFTHK